MPRTDIAVIRPDKLLRYRRVVETRIAEVNRELAAVQGETRSDTAKHADAIDQASIEYENHVVLRRATTSRQLLRKLTEALERMRRGTFGECANCGGEIQPKRLEAIPWARYCIKCQEEAERR